MIVRYKNGDQVKLTPQAQRNCNALERRLNGLGYEISITTLTEVLAAVSEQKFFEIAPAEYVPVRVGQGAWSSQLTTYRSYDIADDFSTGVVNMGIQNARTASADAGIDALTINVINWQKSIGWNIWELQQASKSGSWDLVTQKEEARKKNWDIGIQKTAFLGLNGANGASGQVLGLLNQAGVTVNTSLITAPISGLSTANLKTFCRLLIEAYRANTNRTCYPTHFVIPESDFNGLASQASPDFPIKTVLDLILESFKIITNNPNFKVLPCSYGDAQYHTDAPTIVGQQVYSLHNYDEKSIRMDVPVPYTNTIQNTTDGMSFSNVGYGQFTGVLAYRPLEQIRFQYAA